MRAAGFGGGVCFWECARNGRRNLSRRSRVSPQRTLRANTIFLNGGRPVHPPHTHAHARRIATPGPPSTPAVRRWLNACRLVATTSLACAPPPSPCAALRRHRLPPRPTSRPLPVSRRLRPLRRRRPSPPAPASRRWTKGCAACWRPRRRRAARRPWRPVCASARLLAGAAVEAKRRLCARAPRARSCWRLCPRSTGARWPCKPRATTWASK